MKAISINTAREIGKRSGAKRIAIIAIGDDGTYGVTTWGQTMADCRAMAKWADSNNAESLAVDMAMALSGGSINSSLEPDATSKIGV